ncbi:PHP domain-containing protein [Nocardioides bizhenqiangii]|uniref:PHP domain-containing protein n=1 Tax=Nocardioides bizhenqiangii TaxID=3095076 RepID=A0ABZ0ZU93_9ACTN|nr:MULTISPECIES: PHP domain-containing protein [unclassified Nocardioides]MDZ5623589.1 PHP domain-containing protein [Nocardioides sp. HM23]WQQ27813.1 PHP domain-containing protein [Nocardioides sp. HM61]
MRIDLHAHSRVSDGTQSPAELVEAAAAAGLDVLGLTDHDITAGWAEAAVAARSVGIALVRGIEISTRFRGSGVHLLAYLPDPEDPALVGELQRILQGRDDRVPAMLSRLRRLGIEGATEVALAEVTVDAGATGRPHVADLLVRLGVVADRDQAFEEYLAQGRPAYVDRYAADLVRMIGVVTDAGGVTVVAHPWGRGSADVLDEEAFAVLTDAGLFGIEVDHLDHDAGQREQLRAIASRLGLAVTGSSDHHGTGKVDHHLGVETTAPDQLERIVARAAELGSPTRIVGPEVQS